MGNIRSVANAFEALGSPVKIVSNPEELISAEKIVLPGVGAFADGMNNLKKIGWIDILKREVLTNKVPFLGICLGMQLLATKGTENGVYDGLNWIPGTVEKMKSTDTSIKIPHIGWDDIQIKPNAQLYKGMKNTEVVYFIHSYIFQPENRSIINATCNYGGEFVASIEMDNIFATQFHPEKSQKTGLTVLNNFLDY